jgi:hypothetical protein
MKQFIKGFNCKLSPISKPDLFGPKTNKIDVE